MRTTFDLPDELFRAAKSSAARRGISLKTLVATALEKELRAPNAARQKAHRVRLPLIPSKHPGHIKLTNAEIEELLG
jgi:hypothetical protein